jgi:hypothetical protein
VPEIGSPVAAESKRALSGSPKPVVVRAVGLERFGCPTVARVPVRAGRINARAPFTMETNPLLAENFVCLIMKKFLRMEE